jgi:hypothetical protein
VHPILGARRLIKPNYFPHKDTPLERERAETSSDETQSRLSPRASQTNPQDVGRLPGASSILASAAAEVLRTDEGNWLPCATHEPQTSNTLTPIRMVSSHAEEWDNLLSAHSSQLANDFTFTNTTMLSAAETSSTGETFPQNQYPLPAWSTQTSLTSAFVSRLELQATASAF